MLSIITLIIIIIIIIARLGPPLHLVTQGTIFDAFFFYMNSTGWNGLFATAYLFIRSSLIVVMMI